MSYIGNEPEVNAFTIGVDKFNGTGACTQFTLTRSISDVNAIEVVVNGVQQEPTAAYTVSNGVVTFDEAPSSGTNNIIITYRAPVVVTFNQVTQSQIQAGAVGTTQLADGSVTSDKIAQGTVIAADIADGGVTGTKLGLTSVSGNNIVENAIRSNNIVTEQITGNLLGLYSVSGNNLGIGSVSANNFAGGGITSNVLASNLTISTARISERVNIVPTSVSGNYNIHIGNSSVYCFTANATGNITFNLVANDATATGTTGALNDLVVTGNTVSAAMIVRAVNNGVKYRANVFIDGVAQQAIWTSNIQPSFIASGQAQQYEMYNFQIIKVGTTGGGSGGGQYIVFASNAQFGFANGQGMGPSLFQ
jgi:hypothetical protein